MSQETLGDPDLREAYRVLALELKGTIGRVRRAHAKIEEIEELVFDTVLTELRERKISAYNASIAYANLINSACKLERLKLEILDPADGSTAEDPSNAPWVYPSEDLVVFRRFLRACVQSFFSRTTCSLDLVLCSRAHRGLSYLQVRHGVPTQYKNTTTTEVISVDEFAQRMRSQQTENSNRDEAELGD